MPRRGRHCGPEWWRSTDPTRTIRRKPIDRSRSHMKATIIVEGVFRAGYATYFEEYSARVRRYLEKHQGQVIRRQKIEQTLYGVEKPDLVMVIDFPERALA